MTQRPHAPQYDGDGVYGFLAKSGTLLAYVEWRPKEGLFVLSEHKTLKPIGLVAPAMFNQRVIGYVVG